MAKQMRIPDGNAFKLRIAGQIKTGEYVETADFSVVRNMIVNFVRRGREAQTSSVDGAGRIVVENDGSLARGVYGVELTGYYNGEPWRFYVKDVFQIVNENAESDEPTGVDNVPVYDVTVDVSFGGDGISAAFVEAAVNMHNSDENSHPHILGELSGKVDDVEVDGESIVEEVEDNNGKTKRVAKIGSLDFGKVDDVVVNGVSVVEGKVARFDVPTKVSDLENDEGYAKASEVMTAIEAAAEDLQSSIDDLEQDLEDSEITTVTVNIDNNVGTPSGTATKNGNNLHFEMQNLKGAPFTFNDLTVEQKEELRGEKGDPGESIAPQEGMVPVAHTLGNDTGKVMSQKGVTDAFDSEVGDYTEYSLEDVDDMTVFNNCYYNILNGHSSNSGWKYAKFPVEVGRKYHVKGAGGSNARLWILLDGNDNKLGYDSNTTVSVREADVTISNANAAFLIVNTRTDLMASPVIKAYSTTRSLKTTDSAAQGNSLPITSQGVYALFDSLAVKQIVKNINIPSSERTVTDGFFSINGSPASGAGWTWTRISVEVGDEYTITSIAGQLARLWFVLNENDGVIKSHSYSGSPETITDTVVIPANGAYLAVNKRGTNPQILKKTFVHVNAVDDTPTENSNALILSGAVFRAIQGIANAKSNVLYGKTLCVCGDSITYGADMDEPGYTNNFDIDFYQWGSGSFAKITENARMSYGFQIAERNNMVFYNQGISGSTMQAVSGHNGFSVANGRYTQLPESIDYLVIFFGWNDSAYGTLGTIEDDTNESYYGGYNVVLPYLINKYPYTKIALVVPFGTTEGHRNAIRLLANKWGVACFDFYGSGTPLYYGKETSVGVESSIVTANRAKFQANGAHPNYKGHKQLADMLEGFLKTI